MPRVPGRLAVLLGLVAALLAAAGAAAQAPPPSGTAYVDAGVLKWTARAGEANEIRVRVYSGDATLQDAAPIVPGSGCSAAASGSGVECTGVTSAALDAGDLGDEIDFEFAQVPATLRGGPGDDRIHGGYAANVLEGGGGDDFLEAAYGDDTFDGGDGVDTMSYTDPYRYPGVTVRLDGLRNDGSRSWPEPDGEHDRDIAIENVVGTDHEDHLYGSAAGNRLEGGDANDQIEGGAGADTLLAGWGHDRLIGGTGSDLIDGGPFSPGPGVIYIDTVDYSERTGGVIIKLDDVRNDGADPDGDGISEPGEEADQIIGIENAIGGEGNDVLGGSLRRNTLIGGDGADSLSGGSGDDDLQPGAGGDRVDGGQHSDWISYDDRTEGVAVRLDGVRNDGSDFDGDGYSGPNEEGDDLRNVERFFTGNGNDTLVGNNDAQYFSSAGGDDKVDGGGGSDRIRTWWGADRVTGGDGDDDIDAGDGSDTVDAGTGGDVVAAGSGADGVTGGTGGDRMTTAEGDDTVDGGDGADTVDSGAGADQIRGGKGDDLLDGGTESDVLDGGADIDRVTYASRSARVVVRLDRLRNDGADTDGDGYSEAGEEADHVLQMERIDGGHGSDFLVGDVFHNVIRAGAGNDQIFGGTGDDLLEPGTGQDTIDGGEGRDMMSYEGTPYFVNVKLDGLRNDGDMYRDRDGDGDRDISIENGRGGAGWDVLEALGPEVNVLIGGSGYDTLRARTGGTEADRLLCNLGEDEFAADPSDTTDSCEKPLP